MKMPVQTARVRLFLAAALFAGTAAERATAVERRAAQPPTDTMAYAAGIARRPRAMRPVKTSRSSAPQGTALAAPFQGTPFGSAYARVASVMTLVVALQTVNAHASMPEVLQQLLASFGEVRAEHALLANSVGAFAMYMASDALTQARRQHLDGADAATIDLARVVRSGFTSALLSGFLATFYFALLERALPSTDGVGLLAALAPILLKIAIDVGLYEPLYDTVYISVQAFLRGDDLATTKHELRKVPTVWAMSPRFWGPVDFVNFSCVPLRLRPLYNAVLSIPWSMYLSSMANDSGAEPSGASEDDRAGAAALSAAGA